ncbi:hypothetical protein HHI36_021667 [Cryptolaemus montrouzieri]|uniref:Mariner Mos1 transposase n=1 Tax=Cryptolaemus montrouzieri TaxID=559131 RepID=A0ABD2MXF4_9CUCU
MKNGFITIQRKNFLGTTRSCFPSSPRPNIHAEKRLQYEQRHEKVILQQDNARPHDAKPVKTYLEILPHPLYSPDIAPSDYYLFRSMVHGLADQQLRSYEELEKWLDSWILSKDEHFTVTVFELCQKDGKKL